MKKLFAILAAILMTTGLAQADMLNGGTFLQFTTGLSSHIKPSFSMQPTIGFRLWNEINGFHFAAEGTAFSSDLNFDDSTNSGWSAAAYVKVRSFNVGNHGSLHVLAKGATSSPGSWDFKMNANEYEVGPVLDYEPGARKDKPSGWSGELGIFWMAAADITSQLGVQTRVIVDFQ